MLNFLKKMGVSFFVLLFVPALAFASPSSVDRITDHIEPLIKTDFIKASYYTATSSLKSTFPYASSTAFSVSGPLWLTNTTNGLLASDINGKVMTQATSSATVSSPLTGSITVVGTGQTIGIQNASASQGGAIQITDFNRIYAASSTFTAPLVYTVGTNAVTCTVATASVPGCLAAADFATFAAKITLGNLFNLSTTYATVALSTTTPLWLQGRFFASSTPSLPSQIDNFVTNNSTTTNATSTTFAITSAVSALLLTNSTGGVIKYGGAAACTNQFVTALSALGASTCTSVTDATFSGQLGLAHGGTNATLSGAYQIVFMNAGNTALTTNSLFVFDPVEGDASIGTSTAGYQNLGLLTLGTSTEPQEMWSDNIAADPQWGVRVAGGILYVASSTATATSSISALSINNTTGAFTFNSGATSTFSSSLNATYLNLTGTVASSTAANGLNLTAGCFSIKGTCVGSSSGTPGGTGTELQYRSGSSFGALSPSSYDSGEGDLLIGTSSPTGQFNIGLVTLGTSTEPQLVLSDNNPASALWVVRNSGGSLSFASSTLNATSSWNTLTLYPQGKAIIGLGVPNVITSTLQLYEQNGVGDSPSFIMGGNTGGDTDYWFGRNSNNDGLDNDTYRMGGGSTLGSNIIFTTFNDTRVAFGTSTPAWSQVTISSSTKAQLTLTDGGAGNFGWTMRTINNNFYLATSTAVATSTIAAFSIDPNGIGYHPMGLIAASSTFPVSLWASLQMGVGTSTTDLKMGVGFGIATSTMFGAQVGQYIASTTDPTAQVTIDWASMQSNTIRIIATTSKNIVFNATSSHPLDGGKYILKLCQDATGGRVFTFTSVGVRWSQGTTTGPTTANTCTFIGMQYDTAFQIYTVLASSTAVSMK